jgi:Xaa-Pro dipeptidase
VLENYWDVGGVRIEGMHSLKSWVKRGRIADHAITDNVLITDAGYENLTTAVKEAGEMEAIINGGGSA